MLGSVRTPTAEDRANATQGNPLAETDRPYRLLVEAVVDYAIYLIDPSGRITLEPRRAQAQGAAERSIAALRRLGFTGERLGAPPDTWDAEN